MIYLLPLVCRKFKTLIKNPKETLIKLGKGFFYAVAWMTMATWGVLALLCHTQKNLGFTSNHRIGPLIAICTGTLLVGIDYAYRVQLLLVFMFPKSVEVLVNMLVQRNLMKAKIREYLI